MFFCFTTIKVSSFTKIIFQNCLSAKHLVHQPSSRTYYVTFLHAFNKYSYLPTHYLYLSLSNLGIWNQHPSTSMSPLSASILNPRSQRFLLTAPSRSFSLTLPPQNRPLTLPSQILPTLILRPPNTSSPVPNSMDLKHSRSLLQPDRSLNPSPSSSQSRNLEFFHGANDSSPSLREGHRGLFYIHQLMPADGTPV